MQYLEAGSPQAIYTGWLFFGGDKSKIFVIKLTKSELMER